MSFQLLFYLIVINCFKHLLNNLQLATGWDVGDKTDKPGVNAWNVDIFIGVVQDLVCTSWNTKQVGYFLCANLNDL